MTRATSCWPAALAVIVRLLALAVPLPEDLAAASFLPSMAGPSDAALDVWALISKAAGLPSAAADCGLLESFRLPTEICRVMREEADELGAGVDAMDAAAVEGALTTKLRAQKAYGRRRPPHTTHQFLLCKCAYQPPLARLRVCAGEMPPPP